MKFQKLLLALFALSATLISTANESLESKQEKKIRLKIERLSASLEENRKLLAEEKFRRGVDTTTQQKVVKVVAVENEPVEVEVVPDVDYTLRFNSVQIDSLLCIWRERESIEQYENFFEQYINIESAEVDMAAMKSKKMSMNRLDSLYADRLKKLVSPVALPYNYVVRDYVNRYSSPKSALMSNVMTRSLYYFPLIEEELMKHDLPVELRAMAIIESALISKASSYMGAVGLWQFMPSTGKMYGLEINSLVDERCDPMKSTVAACQFMKDLYNMFDDWTLAIAAYNCGPGNVNKAIRRAGAKEGESTFWDIYDFLPRETRGYVPAFIGASYGYAYHKQNGVELLESPLPLATDTVTVNRIMHLGQVSQVLELPIESLRELNPQYRRDIIPATTKSYSLRLPQKYVPLYLDREQDIHSKDSTFLKQYINPINVEKLRSIPGGRVYVVRRGDTLGGIANRYRVSTRQLMAWNHLKSANRLSIGQKLRVSSF